MPGVRLPREGPLQVFEVLSRWPPGLMRRLLAVLATFWGPADQKEQIELLGLGMSPRPYRGRAGQPGNMTRSVPRYAVIRTIMGNDKHVSDMSRLSVIVGQRGNSPQTVPRQSCMTTAQSYRFGSPWSCTCTSFSSQHPGAS